MTLYGGNGIAKRYGMHGCMLANLEYVEYCEGLPQNPFELHNITRLLHAVAFGLDLVPFAGNR